MPERFSPVGDDRLVFRLVATGSTFLPPGAILPLPSWFEPSSGDVAEGAARGRVPGLSAWDQSLTSVEQARALTARPDQLAFGLRAQGIREVGQRFGRALAIVYDPLDQLAPGPGWEGHVLIEGLKRPPEQSRAVHKDCQVELARRCVPVL